MVLVGIATALWIASYIQITQTIFSSSDAYTRTLFRSCTVKVTPDMGAKIHLSCCVLSAFSWGFIAVNLITIWGAYVEDQDCKIPPIDPSSLSPIGPIEGVINEGRSTEEEGRWQPVTPGETAVT